MIDIDLVWKELGYSRKEYLVKYIKANFTEGEDYQLCNSEEPKVGRPLIKVFLTYECFNAIESRVHQQTKNVYREKVYRAALHSEVGGQKEVKTPVGCVDILTDKEIIEVKSVNDWKTGLGQLLAYSYFYKRKRKRLHLFGEVSEADREVIRKICFRYWVYVTWAKY